MNHAITIGDLMLGIGAFFGLVAVALGALAVFAGGMSDAPAEGDATSKEGCIVACSGLALLIGCLIALIA